MIDYQQALELIKTYTPTLGIESIPLNQALNKIMAENIEAPFALPSFNNSAMDGYALKHELTNTASDTNPVYFSVSNNLPAGQIQTVRSDSLCTKIMTGAVLPDQFDAVIKREEVSIEQHEPENYDLACIKRPVNLHENIRFAGEDFKVNDSIVCAGQRLQAEQIMALSAFGIKQVSVRQPLRVSLLCTGNEIIDSNSDKALAKGEIYNSNLPYLQAALTEQHVNLVNHYQVSDDKASILQQLDQILSHDRPNLIISTGGVSAGDWDHIPSCLQNLGAKIIFHKVAIRPGKPILFAKLHNTLFLCLPGNPISAVVGMRFFFAPMLAHFEDRSVETGIPALLNREQIKKPGLQYFYKAYYEINNQSQLQVSILPGQESFKMQPLLKANCWAAVPKGVSKLGAKSPVLIYPLHNNGLLI